MVRFKDLREAIAKRIADKQTLPDGECVQVEMSPEEKRKQEFATEKYEEIALFIGKYVVLFQQIESEIDQTLLLLIGLDRHHLGTKIVSRLSYNDKIDLLHSTIISSNLASGTEFQRTWLGTFQEVIGELRAENGRRNKLVHSLYLFDFLEIGFPVLRSKRTKRHGDKELDQEYIDKRYIQEAIGHVAELSFDVGMLRRQLISWERDAVTRASTINSRNDEIDGGGA